MDDTKEFCHLIRNRSKENRLAMDMLYGFQRKGTIGPQVSIIRQELDSMIRVIFLLSISNIKERMRLIISTLDGKKWKIVDVKLFESTQEKSKQQKRLVNFIIFFQILISICYLE